MKIFTLGGSNIGEELDNTDIQILVAIHQNPKTTFSEIANLLNLSPTTVSTRYSKITDRTRNRVIGDVNIHRLGLEIVEFLLETQNLTNCIEIENFCDNHYYTLYRSRIFGNFNGIYVQFRIPQGTHPRLLTQLYNFQRNGIIKKIFPLEKLYPKIFTTVNLQNWKGNMQWDFDWNDWKSALSTVIESQIAPSFALVKKKDELFLNKLNKLDFLILEEITYRRARRKNIELIEDIENILKKEDPDTFKPISKQTFSRHRSFVESELISDWRLFFDEKTFDIYNTIAFLANTSERTINSIYYLLKQQPIPFTSTFFPLSKISFFWYIRVPPTHFSQLYKILWTWVDALDVFLFDYSESKHYGLWHKAFDFNTGSWITDY